MDESRISEAQEKLLLAEKEVMEAGQALFHLRSHELISRQAAQDIWRHLSNIYARLEMALQMLGLE